jgi:hypothetical protein
VAQGPVPSHERPIFVVVPNEAAIAPALVAVLDSPDVRAFALPPVWDLDFGGLDPMTGLSDVRRLDLGNLPRAVEWCLRSATKTVLERHVASAWGELPDSVREWFLRRSAIATFAALFKLGRPASSFPPPLSFVEERIRGARFEVSYRLGRVPSEPRSYVAPPEEASVLFYPFDPRGSAARAEAGLPLAGPEAVLEAFAYEAGRDRHRAFLEAVGNPLGWTVVDPARP